MRKFPILPLIALLAAGLTTACENSRPLTEAELPAASQRFLSEHFPGVEISFAKVDTELFDKEYKVVFVTGSKVEFDRRGAWKEISRGAASRASSATAATTRSSWTTASS